MCVGVKKQRRDGPHDTHYHTGKHDSACEARQRTSGSAMMYGGVYGSGMWLATPGAGLNSRSFSRKSPRARVGCSLHTSTTNATVK
jgi:hypothetical protein